MNEILRNDKEERDKKRLTVKRKKEYKAGRYAINSSERQQNLTIVFLSKSPKK